MKEITPEICGMFEMFLDHDYKRKIIERQIAVMVEQFEALEVKIDIYSELDWHMAEEYKNQARKLDLKLLDLYTEINELDGVA